MSNDIDVVLDFGGISVQYIGYYMRRFKVPFQDFFVFVKNQLFLYKVAGKKIALCNRLKLYFITLFYLIPAAFLLINMMGVR